MHYRICIRGHLDPSWQERFAGLRLRLVVGWAMAAHRDAKLVEHALQMALARRHPEAGLLHHSDRGSQYTSGSYQGVLAQMGIQVSMSGKGDCYDNAAMESFFSSLKGEWTDWHTYQTRQEAQMSIFESGATPHS